MTSISITGKFDECADELNDFVATLGGYPDTVLAFALRTHLCALLQALLANGRWTGAEVAIFLQELGDQTVEGYGTDRDAEKTGDKAVEDVGPSPHRVGRVGTAT